MYNTVAPSYDAFYDHRLTHQENWLVIQALMDIKMSLGPKPRVLDVGCGTGAGLGLLHRAGIYPYSYVGLDISCGMLQRARATYGKQNRAWVLADMDDPQIWEDDLNLLPDQFDLVLAFYSLNYSTRITSLMTMLRSRLRIEGRLLAVLMGPDWTCRESIVQGLPLVLYSMTGTCNTAYVAGFSEWAASGIRYLLPLFRLGRAGALTDNLVGDIGRWLRHKTGDRLPARQPRYVMLNAVNGYPVI